MSRPCMVLSSLPVLVPKSNGTWRPVFNLSALNCILSSFWTSKWSLLSQSGLETLSIDRYIWNQGCLSLYPHPCNISVVPSSATSEKISAGSMSFRADFCSSICLVNNMGAFFHSKVTYLNNCGRQPSTSCTEQGSGHQGCYVPSIDYELGEVVTSSLPECSALLLRSSARTSLSPIRLSRQARRKPLVSSGKGLI